MNTVQNKSSFNSEADLLDQTSSPTIFKRTDTTDHKAKTPMSQEPKEMKEMQDKRKLEDVKEKKKAAKKNEKPDN